MNFGHLFRLMTRSIWFVSFANEISSMGGNISLKWLRSLRQAFFTCRSMNFLRFATYLSHDKNFSDSLYPNRQYFLAIVWSFFVWYFLIKFCFVINPFNNIHIDIILGLNQIVKSTRLPTWQLVGPSEFYCRVEIVNACPFWELQ